MIRSLVQAAIKQRLVVCVLAVVLFAFGPARPRSCRWTLSRRDQCAGADCH